MVQCLLWAERRHFLWMLIISTPLLVNVRAIRCPSMNFLHLPTSTLKTDPVFSNPSPLTPVLSLMKIPIFITYLEMAAENEWSRMEGPEINSKYTQEVKIQKKTEKSGLDQGSISLLCKGPDNKYFRLYKPYKVSTTYFYMCIYVYMHTHIFMGFPGGISGKESPCQCRFNPWVRKIHWRRAWQTIPVFLPWKFHGQRNLLGPPWGHRVDMTEAT